LELEDTGQCVRWRFFDFDDIVPCFTESLEFEETPHDSSGLVVDGDTVGFWRRLQWIGLGRREKPQDSMQGHPRIGAL
jgi:hypothetical protein